LIGVHVRICTYRDLEIFAGHLRRNRHNRVGVVAFRGFLTESVQEEKARFVLLHLALGSDPQRSFNDHANDPRGLAALSEHRRVVEVHEDLLGCPKAMQRQFLIAVREGVAGHANLHDVVVELRDLGPPLANLASQQLRMSASGKDRIGIVVDHDAVFAPEQDDRYRRMEQYADGGFQARRPGFDRAKRF